MVWRVNLCVYKSDSITDVGHAFVVVTRDGIVSITGGLSPAQLPDGSFKTLSKVIPGPGKVFSELDSLDAENLRAMWWEVEENAAIAVHNKINADRKLNTDLLPDGDNIPAHLLVQREQIAREQGGEWTGGPDYALLWSNCASYALDLVESAGIDVSGLRSVIPNPASLYNAMV